MEWNLEPYRHIDVAYLQQSEFMRKNLRIVRSLEIRNYWAEQEKLRTYWPGRRRFFFFYRTSHCIYEIGRQELGYEEEEEKEEE